MSWHTRLKKVLLVILGLMAAVSVFQGVRNGLSGQIDFLYDGFRSAIRDHYYMEAYFPSTVWLMFFWGLIPRAAAEAGWVVCNLIFTVIIAWTLRRTFLKDLDILDYWILILAMISGAPWRTNLSNGQYNLAVLAFFLLAVYFSDRDQILPAGLFLSMCIFKYQVAAPLSMYFVFRKRYRIYLPAAALQAVSLAFVSVWLGGVYNATFAIVDDLKGAGAGVGFQESGDVDIIALFGLSDYNIPLFLLAVGLALLAAIMLAGKVDDLMFISIALFISWSLTYNRIYGFVPLIIPVAYFGQKWAGGKKKFHLAAFFLMILMMSAFYWVRTASLSFGLMMERVLFYPALVILLVEVWFVIQRAARTDDMQRR